MKRTGNTSLHTAMDIFFFNPYSWKKLRIYIDIVSVAEGHLGMGTDKQL